MLIRVILAVALVALATFASTPADARKAFDPAKQYFRFELRGFPEGTTCSATNVKGKMKTGKRFGRPFVKVSGYGRSANIFCILPDGKRLVTDLNKTMLANPNYFGAEMHVDTRGNAQGLINSNRGVLETNGFIRDAYKIYAK